MELLRGEELGVRLDREGTLPLADVERVISQAAKGLGKAHHAGVVHRDIKPDNLFLVEDDDDEGFLVKLLDFGIAKIDVLGSSVHHKTTTGSLMGTPLFMSPEQVLGSRKVDSRSDLYSLAVVAYRAITGVVPHDAPALGELIVNISTKAHAAPSTLVAVPASVDAFFARALAKEPEDRWGTAREMADAFSHACRGESLSTLPAPAPSRPDGSVEKSYSSEMSGPPSGPVSTQPASSDPRPSLTAKPGSSINGGSGGSRSNSVAASSPAMALVGSSPAVITPTATASPVPSSSSTHDEDGGARRALTSTAHAQTLPNVAPPSAPQKSRAGMVGAALLLLSALAMGAFLLRKPPTEERLAKSSPLLDVSFPQTTPGSAAPSSPALGIGIGIGNGATDPPASGTPPAPPPPASASAAPPAGKAPAKAPPVGRRRIPGKKGSKSGTYGL